MFKNQKTRRLAAVGLASVLAVTTACIPSADADAASAKKVKSVSLKIGKKKVTKKTYTLKKGKKATIKVTVKPAKAKKKVTFKSSKKSVATVTKKGKVTAKKAGTAKITVTVTGKNKKKKTTWVKIKVPKASNSNANSNATATPSPTPVPPAQSTATPTPTAKPTPNYNNKPFDYSIESNPIGTADENGDPLYGGDPSILVDGDTVYLYVGHDVSLAESYNIPEYCCYSTKDLKNWTYHGVVLNMKDVSWGTGDAAWAGQVMKRNNKYYMYYCSWDKTDSGKQSIGVAVADTPTGPFIDLGQPLVKGSTTTNESSTWNDIDPTAWIETDENGVEHRYLAWGNGKYFVCELNEDMISVKDINGDGKITFGTQLSGATSQTADIVELNVNGLTYTEAPWLYRRKDENGNPYGKYYLFYAYGWREQMAYATTDDLMNGKLQFGSILMPPSATSNTNHMAVFDFKGKTYFVYHNGTLPAGSGFRRTPCIAEVHFNDDGSIQAIPESAAGIFGTTNKIYTAYGEPITHENFENSSADAEYPYTDVAVGTLSSDDTLDSDWLLSKNFYYNDDESYVSIQSENKPGLYLTANDDNTVTLSQNAKLATVKEVAKQQTFKKISGLSDESGISFESVAKPGYYLTVMAGKLYLTDGSTHKANSTFYLDKAPENKPSDDTLSSENSLTKLEIADETVTVDGTAYKASVDYKKKTVSISFEMADSNGILLVDGGIVETDKPYEISTSKSSVTISVYAEDWATVKEYTLEITKDYSGFEFGTSPVSVFNFENTTDGAKAVTKGLTPTAVEKTYNYVDGVNGGKALSLDGTYGMELGDTQALGNSYSISFWMNPTTLGGSVDPIFAAGTFSPECWLNITAADRGIWCKKSGSYMDLENLPTKKYTTGEWQHVLVTVTSENGASTGKLYLNGECIASGKVADGVMTTSNAKAYFGVNGWDAYFNGAVDEIMLFDRVLSEDEAVALSEGLVSASSLSK